MWPLPHVSPQRMEEQLDSPVWVGWESGEVGEPKAQEYRF